MLNFENINFELLEKSVTKSVTTANIIEAVIIGITIIIASYIIFKGFKARNKGYIDYWMDGPVIFSVFILSIATIITTIAIINITSVPYAIANVEVTPTEIVTEEFLKQNDNFVEVDGKIYYKQTLCQTIRELRKNIKSRDEVEKTLEKSFKKIVDAENSKKWFEENTKSINGKSK